MDRRLFARFFFVEALSDKTGPPIPFSRFHLAALDSPKPGYRERKRGDGWHRAIMGPRGNGKTTIYLRIELTHDIVYQIERYIIILAESANLARTRVAEIASEIEHNRLLRHYFGDLVGQELWRKGTGEIDTANGVSVRAKSMESQVRGLLHERTNARPTKIVLDDAEDSQDVLNPDLRARDRRRFSEDIAGAAAVDGTTCFQVTGTPLHREALLPSLRANPQWNFQAFPAIEHWPARMDLWERCRLLWAAAGAPPDGEEGDQARADARSIALRFYHANRREMDRGAKVLWPENEPLFDLMIWRWAKGEAAFSKEKLLVPSDPNVATFQMESAEYPRLGALRHRLGEDAHGKFLRIDTRDGQHRIVRLSQMRFVSFHDPAHADPHAARARARRLDTDFACISVMGIETRENGARLGHIVEAWLDRAPVSEQIRHHFELCEKWGVDLAIVEQDTLALLRDVYRREMKRRAEASLFHQIPLHALEHQTQNKNARIATMQPAVESGSLTFSHSLTGTYWHQWVDHPTGTHDDGPDSAEGCWRFSGRKRAGLTLVRLVA